MPNCADTAKFRVGRLADVLYAQFCAHVICCVETKMSGRRRRRRRRRREKKREEIPQPQTETVVGLETEKDLEDERTRRASVLPLFSLSLFF